MGNIFDVMLDFFREDDWKFYQLSEQRILRLDVSGRNGEWLCYANADEEGEYFSFYSTCPVKVPEAKKVAMSELLTRINYGLRLGNFELNFSDGEIRYRRFGFKTPSLRQAQDKPFRTDFWDLKT